jgi:hypothetical protein
MSADEIPKTISALKDLIVKTLEVRMRFPVGGGSILAPTPYQEFAKLLEHIRSKSTRPHSVSVITFNYDIAVDLALNNARMGPYYALDETQKRPDFVPLLKLHGSLNWAKGTADQGILPLHLANYLGMPAAYTLPTDEVETTLPIGSVLRRLFVQQLLIEVEQDPVIVPPTWNKADYHQALTTVWANAAKHLSEAAYIFVIGYSLPSTDSFFRHLYALGSVGTAPLRAFWVCNPERTDGPVDTRFQEILGPGAKARYRYLEMNFDLAIEVIRALFPPKG